ncbi:MAG: preprotein translocase subunit SecG, partial [Deltaproteobacteria bacterium]
MIILVTVLHVIACLFLIVVVLLQTGKGADVGAVFGGSSQTIFGSSGAGNLLTRLTTWTAAAFMLTSLFLTWNATHGLTKSVVDTIPVEPPPIAAPAAPVAPAADAVKSTGESVGQAVDAAKDAAGAAVDKAAGAAAAGSDAAKATA